MSKTSSACANLAAAHFCFILIFTNTHTKLIGRRYEIRSLCNCNVQLAIANDETKKKKQKQMNITKHILSFPDETMNNIERERVNKSGAV